MEEITETAQHKSVGLNSAITADEGQICQKIFSLKRQHFLAQILLPSTPDTGLPDVDVHLSSDLEAEEIMTHFNMNPVFGGTFFTRADLQSQLE